MGNSLCLFTPATFSRSSPLPLQLRSELHVLHPIGCPGHQIVTPTENVRNHRERQEFVRAKTSRRKAISMFSTENPQHLVPVDVLRITVKQELWVRRQQSIKMLPPTSTEKFLLWIASLSVAALSGFGIGLYVSSRPEAVENPPNTGTASHNLDSDDDNNDLEEIATVKAGILEPCKMARTLHITCARSSNHFCRSSW